MRVLVVGGGPGGLRAAIETRLNGAHVELAEMRNEISRHNVLHLWSPVAEDALTIGLKSFIPRLGSSGSEKVRMTYTLLVDLML
jgi:flavin-dependent dehydrogenase